MPKDQGQDYGLFLADSQPSDLSTPTGYDLVGFATDHSLSIDRELIEAASKDTAGDMEYVTGRRTPTIEGTFYLDIQYQNDAGQDHVLNEIQRDATDTLYFLLSDEVSGHIQFNGECLTENAEMNFPDQEMIELSITLQVQLGVTIEAVP